jgi:hypothetical protein
MRIVPWKHTPGMLGPVANAHGEILWKVTCTRAPTIDPSVTTPLSTAVNVWMFCVPSMSAVNEWIPPGSVTV